VAVCYIGGTAQYCAVTGTAVIPALFKCVVPFIPFDLFKCVAAVAIGRNVRLVKDHFASR
jgi:biotin transporter BioY